MGPFEDPDAFVGSNRGNSIARLLRSGTSARLRQPQSILDTAKLRALETHELDQAYVNTKVRRSRVKAGSGLPVFEHVLRAAESPATGTVEPNKGEFV